MRKPLCLILLLILILSAVRAVGGRFQRAHLDAILISAVKRGDPTGIERALRSGADPDATDLESGLTGLQLAAYSGDEASVLALLASRRVTPRRLTDGLLMAAWMGQERIASVLLADGVSVNVSAADGRTPLMSAAEAEPQESLGALRVAQLLMRRGADLNARDARGRTALMHAAERCFDAMVRELLSRGTDKRLRDRDGLSASQLARSSHCAALGRASECLLRAPP